MWLDCSIYFGRSLILCWLSHLPFSAKRLDARLFAAGVEAEVVGSDRCSLAMAIRKYILIQYNNNNNNNNNSSNNGRWWGNIIRKAIFCEDSITSSMIHTKHKKEFIAFLTKTLLTKLQIRLRVHRSICKKGPTCYIKNLLTMHHGNFAYSWKLSLWKYQPIRTEHSYKWAQAKQRNKHTQLLGWKLRRIAPETANRLWNYKITWKNK